MVTRTMTHEILLDGAARETGLKALAAGNVTAMVSGPMSGLPDFNRPAFNVVSQDLELAGHRALNPARQPNGLSWEEYMRRSLIDVCQADVVVLLPGWQASRGATLEVEVARRLHIPVVPVEDLRQTA